MLEKPLLEETKSYYRREAAELHADNTCHLFITKVLFSWFILSYFLLCIDSDRKLCILWISYIGTTELNEYINAKKIIEVKEATYAVESLK